MSEEQVRTTTCDICGDTVPVDKTEHCNMCGRTYCLDCEGGSVGICETCEDEDDEW